MYGLCLGYMGHMHDDLAVRLQFLFIDQRLMILLNQDNHFQTDCYWYSAKRGTYRNRK